MIKNIFPLIFLLAVNQTTYTGHKSVNPHRGSSRNTSQQHRGNASYTATTHPMMVNQNTNTAGTTQPMPFTMQQAPNTNAALGTQQMVANSSIAQPTINTGQTGQISPTKLKKTILKISILEKNITVLKSWIEGWKIDHVDKISSRTANDITMQRFINFLGTEQGRIFNPQLDLIQPDGLVVIWNESTINSNVNLINPLTGTAAVDTDLVFLTKHLRLLSDLANALLTVLCFGDAYRWQIEVFVKNQDAADQKANADRGHKTTYNGHNWMREPLYIALKFLTRHENKNINTRMMMMNNN